MGFRKYHTGFSFILTVAALCTTPLLATAQSTPAVTVPGPAAKPVLQDAEKEKNIRQLITLTGGDKMADQAMDRMIPAMQKMIPDAPLTFWQEFRKKTKTSDLVDLMLPIYDKYYSKADVEGLIQFYQTPLGQKMISVAPGIAQETYVVGTAWGQKKAQEVIDELKAKDAAQPAPTKAKPAKAPAAKPHKTATP